MTHETRILLILLPSVMYGGLSILSLLIDDPVTCARRCLAHLSSGSPAVCGRGQPVRRNEAARANFNPSSRDPGPGRLRFLGGLARCNGPEQSHQLGLRGRRCAGDWRPFTRRRPYKASRSRRLNTAPH